MDQRTIWENGVVNPLTLVTAITPHHPDLSPERAETAVTVGFIDFPPLPQRVTQEQADSTFSLMLVIVGATKI
jgi:hypothetical protein